MVLKFVVAMLLAAVTSVAANALELDLTYDIVTTPDGRHVVSAVLEGYQGENRRDLVICGMVYPLDRQGNPYIADISCDGQFVSIVVTQCGVLLTLDGMQIAQFSLEPGKHLLNGLPLLVDVQARDPQVCLERPAWQNKKSRS